ncbi:hypothetical protein BSL78_21753 [Apostichopus japonicus]|uniref:G-protein coupled receptors family 1 profile domain-containing protein n=1 Tax=Stichopus japonicus TaxID=307972 RepID=A0A2G8K094_STIJA|nr:hypothetical protein BSL78_21753 [Apostichopus japonicus]
MDADLSFYNDTMALRNLAFLSYYSDLAGNIIFTLIAYVAIAANGLVLFKVLKFQTLRTPMNYFITNLAAADMILIIVLIGPRNINFFTSWKIFTNRVSLIAINYIQHICIQATALILAIMSISRYTMVVLPLKAKAEWTGRMQDFGQGGGLTGPAAPERKTISGAPPSVGAERTIKFLALQTPQIAGNGTSRVF